MTGLRRAPLSAARLVLPLFAFLAGLPLFDLIGEMVLALSGTVGSGGLLGSVLPAPPDAWLTVTPSGWLPGPNMVLLTALVLALAVGLFGSVVAQATRLGALALLLALALPLVAWSPITLGIIGGQAMLLIFDRGGRESDVLLQATRLIGMVLVVLLAWSTPPALVVSLIAVALAPSAMLTVSRPSPDLGAEGSGAVATTAAPAPAPAPAKAAPRDGKTAADPPVAPQVMTQPDGLVDVVDAAPAPETTAPPGPFGHDPVAALAHLTPAPAMVEAARSALVQGQVQLLAITRLDGLAGIAEHLGIVGGEALFAEASARLESALPSGALLSWLGDETFAALLPAEASGDPDAIVVALAAPFAADLQVDGRPVSMEDALHVDVMALDADTLPELARWAESAPA